MNVNELKLLRRSLIDYKEEIDISYYMDVILTGINIYPYISFFEFDYPTDVSYAKIKHKFVHLGYTVKEIYADGDIVKFVVSGF